MSQLNTASRSSQPARVSGRRRGTAAVAETDAKREARVLEHTVPYWQSKETESGGFGWQTEQRWRDTIDVARKLGLIETALRAEDVFVNTYLSK